MWAPFQDGDLPGPVKYGNLNVGVADAAPPALRGSAVLGLNPYQMRSRPGGPCWPAHYSNADTRMVNQ